MSEFPKTLTKGEQRRTANSQADVVRFQFDGFKLATPAAFDPAAHSVAEVQDYLATADEAERDRVLAAESEGKGRSTLLG